MISISHLSVDYETKRVLNDLSMEFHPGKVYGLIGPNGAGKSTLLKALVGLVESHGEIKIAGRNLHSLKPKQLARLVAYLAQDTPAISDFTGRELAGFGRYSYQSRFAVPTVDDEIAVENALKATGAIKWADQLVSQTSGGERQLTGLSRALAQEAPVLLLDEPVSALDMAHEVEVLKLLHPWIEQDKENRLVITVLHDLSTAARFCDELLLLEPNPIGARLKSQGCPEEVLQPSQLAETYGIEVDVRRSAVTGTLEVTPL